MVQLTLNTEVNKKKEELKVPVFIFKDKYEVRELARLIVEVKPTYLINISNSVKALKTYAEGRITKDIVFIMDSGAVAEINNDKKLVTKIKFVDLFN